MFSYLQMPFLQALGYAIANSIWQVFLLWLIVLLVNSLAKQSSHIRYVTALSAQVAGFVWFLTTFQFYYRHCHTASVQAAQLADGDTAVYLPNVVAGSDNLLSTLIRAEETLPYLSLTYLILLLYLAVRWVQNYRFTNILYTSGLEIIDKEWQLFVNDMSDKLNILQEVKIYLSSVAKSPLTIGYLKPVILLPVASLNHLTTEQLEAVILHELAHIKRADYIINLLVSIAEMVMFFNPFTHLLSRTLHKERENCCDDWVLQHQYSAGMYAEALLRIACLQQQQGFQMNAAASKQKGELLQRVKRMVQPSEKKMGYRHQAMAMMVIAALLFCIAWLQPDENSYRKTTAANNHTENKKVVIAPIMAQVDNPFFNGASLLSSSLHDDVIEQLTELDKAVADSDTELDLDEAHKTLKTVAPLVVATVSSGNWQRIAKEAAESVSRNLETVAIPFSDIVAPQFPDSAFLVQTVNEALVKTGQYNAIQKGLEAAGKEIEKLQQNKIFNKGFTLSFDNLGGLGANALASLQNLHFDVIKDSLTAVTEQLRKATRERTEKADERRTRQVMLIKQLQEHQDKLLAVTDRKRIVRMSPPPPALSAQVPEVSDDEATESPDVSEADDDAQDASYNWSYSVPSVTYTTLPQCKTAKTIHITRNDDNGNISIVIEIKQ